MTATWPPSSRIPYLDGLRAYSITTVVVLHCSNVVPWLNTRQAFLFNVLFGNGEMGVHIFFILSGFLITTILLQEWDRSGRISIRAFYERRIARIFPAFYTYLLIIAILILTGLAQVHWAALVSAATFTWNYGFFLNKGRTATDALLLSTSGLFLWRSSFIWCGLHAWWR